MPGGLLQLVATGAQNELVNGSPSMTHFRAVYRRHTNFAMDQIRMPFSTTADFLQTTPRTVSCRIDRYAQLLHDCYVYVTLPDIYSPLKSVSVPPTGYDGRTRAIGYEFQWISNLGYNLIDHVDIVLNGQVIQSLTGEWLKAYSYMTHDSSKREHVDEMTGNIAALKDPANAYDRNNQYPHAVTPVALPAAFPTTRSPEPSIRSRTLVIPLHFWFCENPGLALPLVSLQNSEAFINVTWRALTDLYTVIDVTSTSPTYGQRVRPTNFPLQLFLSPPLSTGLPSNPTLTTWDPDAFVEGTFIYLSEMEMNQMAKADQTFLVKTVRYVMKDGQYGGNTDLELPFFNLVTRIVFLSQRNDQTLTNQWDNYTNWTDPNRAPWTAINTDVQTSLYTSGQLQISSEHSRDALVDGVILFDGKERIQPKPLPFFSRQQMYRHATGSIKDLPGVYMYSFALEHASYQPSGSVNGSLFNKVILRLSLQQPKPVSTTTNPTTIACVLTSSLFSQHPVIVPAENVSMIDTVTGKLLYPPGTLTTVVLNSGGTVSFAYTFNVGVYVESMNFLRIVSGVGNLVFAS